MASRSRTVSLTDRDRALLDALTHRVRVLTLQQLADAWWDCDVPKARTRLQALEQAGWLRSLDLLAHPLIELREPAAVWAPRGPRPAFAKVAHQLSSRWKSSPKVHTAIVATERAGVRLAGHGGRVPRPAEATHDIHLGQVYLDLLRSDPSRAGTWISEEELHTQGYGRDMNLPDAMLLDGGGGKPTVIEFGGAYRPAKLEQFHRFCEREALRYEVW